MRAEKFTVPFAVFAISHGRKCDMAEKFTVSFGNIGVRHGIVTPRIKEVTNPFIKRIFVRCSIRHP